MKKKKQKHVVIPACDISFNGEENECFNFSVIASLREMIDWFVAAVAAQAIGPGLPLHKGFSRVDFPDVCLSPLKKQRAPRARLCIVRPGFPAGCS